MSEQTQKPVQNQIAPNEMSESFANAEESLYSILEKPEFAETCLQLGLDPIKSTDTAQYWDIVSEYAVREIDDRRAYGDSEQELTAFELTALAPSFLHAKAALREHSAQSAREQRQLKSQASYYNGLLRYAGSNFDLRASEASLALENVAAIAGFRDNQTSVDIRDTIRGAQHELAFSQILSHAGFNYEGATVEQDLLGADYTVNIGGKDMLVDVKASLSEVEALGGGKGAFAVRWPRREGQQPVTVMYSLAKDSDFHDTFHIPDDVASERAPAMADLLQQAQRLQAAA